MLVHVDQFENSDQEIYNSMMTKEARESKLELQANAALIGRDLRPYDQLEVLSGGYKASVGISINISGWANRGL